MIPYCILVIEDDDDRTFMEQLFVDYHRLMYHEIFKLVHDQWAAEDVMQSTLVRLIDKIPELRLKDRGSSGELYYNGFQESGPQLPAGLWASFCVRPAGIYGVRRPQYGWRGDRTSDYQKGRPGGVGPYLDAAG